MPVIMHFFSSIWYYCVIYLACDQNREQQQQQIGGRMRKRFEHHRERERNLSKKSKRKWQINWHSEYHQHCTPNRFANLLLLLLRLLLYANGCILASKYTSAKSLLAKLLYERPLCHRRLQLQTDFEPHSHSLYLHFLHRSPWPYVRQAWLERKCARLCVRRLVREAKNASQTMWKRSFIDFRNKSREIRGQKRSSKNYER